MRLVRLLVCVSLVVLTARVITRADTPTYHINMWTLSAATGGVSSSYTFALAGTLAQPVTSIASAGTYGYASTGLWTPHYVASLPAWFEVGEVEIDTLGVPEIHVPRPAFANLPEVSDWFPRSISLPPFPSLSSPEFPSEVELPPFPSLSSPEFPSEVELPPFPRSNDLSVITLTQSITMLDRVITSTIGMPIQIAQVFGLDVSHVEEGGTVNMNIEIGGFQVSEVATEITDAAHDVADLFGYVRALLEFPVAGRLLLVLLLSFVWVLYIKLSGLLVQFFVVFLRSIVRLWELLPFKAS